MKTHNLIKSVIILLASILCVHVGYAENIDPYEDGSQYAYGENAGWLNFEPNLTDPNLLDPNVGVTVTSEMLTGFIWAENIGWISLSCENTDTCGTVNYGVTNDWAGNLSGYGWGENVGWISFSCENTASCGTVDYGVTIDVEGNFSGYAWAENIGWTNFNDAAFPGYHVLACRVSFIDLGKFVDDWLKTGRPGDLNCDDMVDFNDYSVLASCWLDYCGDDWPLK